MLCRGRAKSETQRQQSIASQNSNCGETKRRSLNRWLSRPLAHLARTFHTHLSSSARSCCSHRTRRIASDLVSSEFRLPCFVLQRGLLLAFNRAFPNASHLLRATRSRLLFSLIRLIAINFSLSFAFSLWPRQWNMPSATRHNSNSTSGGEKSKTTTTLKSQSKSQSQSKQKRKQSSSSSTSSSSSSSSDQVSHTESKSESHSDDNNKSESSDSLKSQTQSQSRSNSQSSSSPSHPSDDQAHNSDNQNNNDNNQNRNQLSESTSTTESNSSESESSSSSSTSSSSTTSQSIADNLPSHSSSTEMSRSNSQDESSSPSSSSDEEQQPWIEWFCSLPENEFLCHVDLDYAQDNFNLTGLEQHVRYFDCALDVICDAPDASHEWTNEQRKQVYEEAEQLYGLIHARFIITSRGLALMSDKLNARVFGRCPRVQCRGAAVLPCATSDQPKQDTVKMYCCVCEELYSYNGYIPFSRRLSSQAQHDAALTTESDDRQGGGSSSSRRASDRSSNSGDLAAVVAANGTKKKKRLRSEMNVALDGATIGTTFAHLFYLTYPELRANNLRSVRAHSNASRSNSLTYASVTSSASSAAAAARASTIGHYVPRIFGFRISSTAHKRALEAKQLAARQEKERDATNQELQAKVRREADSMNAKRTAAAFANQQEQRHNKMQRLQ